MKDKYCLEIGYREDLDKENIDPFYIELRNQNRIDDEKEEILTWTKTREGAVKFAEDYIKNHNNVKYYQFGES